MGQKYVDPNPGNNNEEKPFRTSTLVVAGPKSLYGDGETGQKFVMPNPGQNNEALVRNEDVFRTHLELSHCSHTATTAC